MKTLPVLALLLPVALLPACVSLEKPLAVKVCSSKKPAECRDGDKTDAAVPDASSKPTDTSATTEDVPSPQPDTGVTPPKPDTAVPDSTVTPKPDAAVDATTGKLDTTAPTPDTTPAKLDTKPVSPDTTTPSPDTTVLPPDTAPVKPDTAPPSPDTTVLPPDTAPPTPDTAPASPFNCPTFKVTSGGQSIQGGSTGAFCIVTCDDMSGSAVGWNCSNLDGATTGTTRTVKINGETVACGKTPIPPKVSGYAYNVFEIGAGKYDYASVYWWGQTDNKTCNVPTSGP